MASARKRLRKQRRHLPYRATPLCRHRVRVRWLLAQRIRVRNYLRKYRDPSEFQDTNLEED